jgi:hypothetical protein
VKLRRSEDLFQFTGIYIGTLPKSFRGGRPGGICKDICVCIIDS